MAALLHLGSEGAFSAARGRYDDIPLGAHLLFASKSTCIRIHAALFYLSLHSLPVCPWLMKTCFVPIRDCRPPSPYFFTGATVGAGASARWRAAHAVFVSTALAGPYFSV